jgi:hypothetical protein
MDTSNPMSLLQELQKANQKFSSMIFKTMDYILSGSVEVFIVADVTGTFYFEESDDMNIWSQTKTFTILPNIIRKTGKLVLAKQYFRFRYVNGDQDQKHFKIILNFSNITNSAIAVKTVKTTRYGPGNSTFILDNPCTRIAIENPAEQIITVSIDGINIRIQPYGVFEDDFEPFTDVIVTAVGDWSILFKS